VQHNTLLAVGSSVPVELDTGAELRERIRRRMFVVAVI
jgi:hypothetical protein